jgi:outer membrane lipoprotein-sorting protein
LKFDIKRSLLPVFALSSLLTVTGCVSHVRTVVKPRQIGVVEEASLDQLIGLINKRYDAIKSVTATVYMQASVGGAHPDQVKDYTSFRAYILIRKPAMLRVLGLVPVVQTHMFDMASDGTTFKLFVPPRNKAITGPDAVTTPSVNALENMRPNLFLEAMLVRGVDHDEFAFMTADTRIQTDPQSKQLIEVPDYNLNVVMASPRPNRGIPERVIHIDRSDLNPYQQDFYNPKGVVETMVTYGAYQDFAGVRFPSVIRITRPLDKYEITITVEKLSINQSLTDDQFDLKIPEGTVVQTLK